MGSLYVRPGTQECDSILLQDTLSVEQTLPAVVHGMIICQAEDIKSSQLQGSGSLRWRSEGITFRLPISTGRKRTFQVADQYISNIEHWLDSRKHDLRSPGLHL